MFCPNCRAEYRAGVAECHHCKVALVAELPEEDTFASLERMATALVDKEIVPLMQGALGPLTEAQDFLRTQRIATVMAAIDEEVAETAVHAQFHLMVAPDELDRARGTLEQRWQSGVEREGLLLGDAPAEGSCPACGTAVPESASECPDCGLFLGPA